MQIFQYLKRCVKICLYVYEVDEDNIFKSFEGHISYLLYDIIYLLIIEENVKAFFALFKDIVNVFNLCHCFSVDHRFAPCFKTQIALTTYNRHVRKCYVFEKNSTLLALPEEGRVMVFNNFAKSRLERRFVVYADTECALVKFDEQGILHSHRAKSVVFCILYAIMFRVFIYYGLMLERIV